MPQNHVDMPQESDEPIRKRNLIFRSRRKKFVPKSAHLIDAEVALSPPPTRFNLRSGQNFRLSFDATPNRGNHDHSDRIQFAIFTLTAAYLAFSVVTLHRRNQLSWESLSSRLHPAWSPRATPAVAVLRR